MMFRVTLIREVVLMAVDTVRTNRLRSALTVVGVVIGITSIVGMTAMIRGFDQSLRNMIRSVGPNVIFFPLAPGPHPRRDLSLMPRLGFTVLGSAWPQALFHWRRGPTPAAFLR